jgi:very-short-patch-repair endonuclease
MKLENNVNKFLNESSVKYADFKKQEFQEEMTTHILENGINSPIEQIYYIAFNLLCAAAHEVVNAPQIVNDDFTVDDGYGLHIQPQFQVGKYTVDFLVYYTPSVLTPRYKKVIVELDGHAFHDKDKNQRAYEKARDRYLVKEGYSVLHYTGSELVANPYKVVCEAIKLAGAD